VIRTAVFSSERLPSWQPFAQRKECRIDKQGRLFHLLRPRCSKILFDPVQGGFGHYPKNLQRDEEWCHNVRAGVNEDEMLKRAQQGMNKFILVSRYVLKCLKQRV
jgi:hypothetical protein